MCNYGLRGRDARDRHAERRAGHVVQASHVEELDRLRIAAHADFFSFGTNDLTQTALGFSRDDVESKFVPVYMERKIIDRSPFETIDKPGVGWLVRLAAWVGRESNPSLKLGICGEHGGDPESIEFFHMAGLDYVSCSPYRVPIARVAAARAVIAHSS